MDENASPEVSAEVVPAEDAAHVALPHYTNVQDLIENEPNFVEAVREYYVMKRNDLQARVNDIDDFIGFTRSEADLSSRVAKVEQFLGIKPK